MQKSKEEIISQYEPNSEYTSYYHESQIEKMMEEYHSQFPSPEPSKDVEAEAKELCTKFFYWWYNQKGSNTDQGFDDWAKTNEGKNLISKWAEQGKEATLVDMECDMYDEAGFEVINEVRRAKTLFKENFVNQHEGYAVIHEELDELWQEVKKNQKNYDIGKQRKEAVQCAAMCIRFISELTTLPPNDLNDQRSVATGDAQSGAAGQIINIEELKKKYAEHLIDTELNTGEAHAVEWTVKNTQ